MFILEVIKFPSMIIENIVFVRCENSLNKFYYDELNLMQFYQFKRSLFLTLFYLILHFACCRLCSGLADNPSPKPKAETVLKCTDLNRFKDC